MKKLFISYSRENSQFALRLTKDLRRIGMSIWIDEAKIMVGQQFKNQIRTAISNVDYVIVIVSSSSNASPWVRFELDSAIMREKSDGRDIILPVLTERVDLPEGLESRLFVDFNNQDDYQANFALLAERLGRFGDINVTEPLRVPEGISINEFDNKLYITRDWKSGQLSTALNRMIASEFFLLSVAVGYFWKQAFRLSGALDYLALLLFIALSLMIAKSIYILLTAYINKQTIELSPKHLKVRHGPLPSRQGKTCQIPSSMIKSIECVEEKLHLSRHTIFSYSLCVICVGNEKIEIPTGTLIYNPAQGVFLRDTIISYLEVTRTAAKQISTPIAQETAKSDFEHENILRSFKREDRTLLEPRKSIWLGDFSDIGYTLARKRFRTGTYFGIIGLGLLFMQYQQEGSWWINGAIEVVAGLFMMSSGVIAFNSRQLLEYASIAMAPFGVILMIRLWLSGSGYVAIVGIASLVCMESLYRLSKIPSQFMYPDLVESLPIESNLADDSNDDLVIDVCISRKKISHGREKLYFVSSKELLEKLIEWRGVTDPVDICLTWGKTTADVAVRVRNSIYEQVGLMYLLDEERENAWKQMTW